MRSSLVPLVLGCLAAAALSGEVLAGEGEALASASSSSAQASAPLRQLSPQSLTTPQSAQGNDPSPQDARILRVVGRFAFQPPGHANYSGVDSIYVEIRDDDTIGHSVIWAGFTNNDGVFDTGMVDITDDDNEPDIYAYFETDTPIVSVDGGGYSWSSENSIVGDFQGEYLDLGTQTPADPNGPKLPALSFHQDITRSWQFVFDVTGIQISKVNVDWPSGDFDYDYDGDIILGEFITLTRDTLHQYAHHIESDVDMGVSVSGECGNFCHHCDMTDSCSGGDPLEYCRWCPSTAPIARSEAFADWFSGAANRYFMAHYLTDSGTPYRVLATPQLEFFPSETIDDTPPIFITDLSEMRDYCGADVLDNADRVELAVSRFLYDVSDADIDDHALNGTNDCAALGDDALLLTYLVDKPADVLALITDLITRYPDSMPALYASAKNMSPVYLTPFPADTEAPGAVPPGAFESPTHDEPASSNAWPCLHVRFQTPDDDVSGGCAYSIEWSQTPDVVPDTAAELVGTCPLVKGPALTPGTWYVCVRVQDCAGHWSNDTSCLGPFEIADCNNNGVPDACDVFWLSEPDPDPFEVMGCSLPPGFCDAYPPPSELDCNKNFVPDSCDVAYGASDCNLDGIPDECESIAKWADGNGDWAVADNWDRDFVPTASEFVCIGPDPQDLTITVSTGDQEVGNYACHENLSVTGGTLTTVWDSFVFGDLTIGASGKIEHDATLSVYGLFDWQGGWLYSATSTEATTLIRGGASLTNGGVTLGAKHIFDLAAGDVLATATIVLQSQSLVRIQQGTTYEYRGNSNIFYGAVGSAQIEGTLVRSSGTGFAYIQAPVDNTGTILNQTGNLVLSYGGTHSGNVIGDLNTKLTLSRNTEMLPGSSLNVDELYLLNGLDSMIRGDVLVGGLLTVEGSSWTFTDEANVVSYGTDLLAKGIVHFESPATQFIDFDSVVVGEGNSNGVPYFDTGETFRMNSLHMVRGNFYGADPVTINDSFIWSGASSFMSGGAVTCDGPVTIQATSSQRNLSRLFYNNAHADFYGSFSPNGSGRFYNTATGTVDLHGDHGLTGGQSTNDGTITKTSGTGWSTLSGMTNTGFIRALIGVLSFPYGGENSGIILGDPGTLLRFSGTYDMTPGSSLTGDDVTFSGATATVRGDVDISGTLTIDGGTCTFTNEADVTSYGQQVDALTGNFYFESPTPGPTVDFDGVQIGGGSYSAGVYFDTGQPVTIGTLHIINGNVNGSDPITITDAFTWGGVGSFLYGGKVTCNADSTVQYSSSQRNCYRHFDNNGYLTLLGAFNPSGGYNFTNLEGGVVDMRNDSANFGLSSTSTVHNYGTLIKSGGSGTSNISSHFHNAGIFEIQSGSIAMTGNYGITQTQTAGATILNGGGFNLLANAIYQIQGGDLTGNGTITGKVNNSAGRVVPGLSIGTLTCDGDYTHGAGATLKIELGGLNAGSEHDQLVVTGTADLDGGVLHVLPFAPFTPQVGQEFVVLTAGSVQGEFDTITGPGTYTATYNPTNVTLTVVEPPCSTFVAPDFDRDCDVDGDDVDLLAACASWPTVPYAPGCEEKDLDSDGDVDQMDFAKMQLCISGPGIAVASNCLLQCTSFVGPDFDLDCDVDGDDVAAFVACAAGPMVPHDPGCEEMDFDLDGDTDQMDFALLQRCISGPGLPAEMNCAN